MRGGCLRVVEEDAEGEREDALGDAGGEAGGCFAADRQLAVRVGAPELDVGGADAQCQEA